MESLRTPPNALLWHFPELVRPYSRDLSDFSTKHHRLQPPGTIPPDPSRGDAGHRVNSNATRDSKDGLAGCAPLRDIRASISSTTTARASAQCPFARALKDRRIPLQCGRRSMPQGSDCPALSTDQAISAASRAALALHPRRRSLHIGSPHVGAALHQSSPLRFSLRRSKTTWPQQVATCSQSRSATIGKPSKVFGAARTTGAPRTNCRHCHQRCAEIAELTDLRLQNISIRASAVL